MNCSHMLVIDGMVQDARAPKGTLIYTDDGIKYRKHHSMAHFKANGLSAAQYTASGLNLNGTQISNAGTTTAKITANGITYDEYVKSGATITNAQLLNAGFSDQWVV